MNKLNEAKENLPIDFLTQFISKGWSEVGALKASIEGIKKEFKGTNKVEDVLQNLIDAYLIAIGQMELYLDKKDYLDIPEENQLNEKLILEENSIKNISKETNITNSSSKEEVKKDNSATDNQINKDSATTIKETFDEIEEEDNLEEVNAVEENDTDKEDELFEFFTDFDDPEPDEESAAEIKAWLNH